MAAEFGLLGDVVATVNGLPVDLGHEQQRRVLVALLVDANQVVSVDRLIERVWADRPPQRARQTLYSYVSRLRGVLAGMDVPLSRQPGGYLLTIDPMTVDLHRFRSVLGQARAAGGEQALALYQQAFELWRGDPFAYLDVPWLNMLRETLRHERFVAELDRNDLALAGGRLGGPLPEHPALPELSMLAAEHPLDERLAGQLMLALYLHGRSAQALEQYHLTRRLLSEELGTDPGPALRELQRRILNADPSLPGPAAGSEPPAPAEAGTHQPPARAPAQLPADVPKFTGRAAELTRLDALLPEGETAAEASTTTAVSVISGPAGVGKTALALHWAHQVADRFPDGQLYVNLRGFDASGAVLDPADAIRGFLDALGVGPQRVPVDLDGRAALYRSLLSGKRMLVVLDNARDAVQVRPLLPGSPGCVAVVTSRSHLSGIVAGQGANPLTLDLLAQAEARQLLADRLGARRIEQEPWAADEIVAACARLPLALTVVAARAATYPHFPLASLAAELAASHGRLAALAGGDPATDVRAVFSWSYRTLTPAAARLFRLLGLHPGPDLGGPAAASLAAVAPEQARALLAELTRTNLLIEHVPGRYACHDLLRTYAVELGQSTDSDSDRRAAIHRVLDHYLHSASVASRALDPHSPPVSLAPAQPGVVPERPADHLGALEWFTTEHPVLLTTVDQAAANGFDTHVWNFSDVLWTFLDRRGHWNDRVAIARAALAAARRLGDLSAQAEAHRNLAGAYTRLGRLDDARAELNSGLQVAIRAGDQDAQAYVHNNLAFLWERLDAPARALEHAQQSLRLFQATGHQRGQARLLNGVGWYHALLGDYEQALKCCQEALALHEQLGDREGQANTWDSIAYAHHQLGQYAEALTCYQHALDLFLEQGDRYHEAETLTRLGDTHHSMGNTRVARAAWQRAVSILDDLDHPGADDVRAQLAKAEFGEAAC